MKSQTVKRGGINLVSEAKKILSPFAIRPVIFQSRPDWLLLDLRRCFVNAKFKFNDEFETTLR